LVNYGLSYDLSTGDESVLDPPAKRFRGVLDALFEQQREAGGAQGSEDSKKKEDETKNKQEEEAKKQESACKGTQEAEAKPKAKAKAGAAAGSATAAVTGAAACSATVAVTGAAASSATAAVTGAAASSASATGAAAGSEAKPPSTDLVIGSLTTPPAKVLLRSGKLHIKSQSSGNKKMPPGTLLAQSVAGDVKKCDNAGDVPYKMTPLTRVYARGPKKVMALNTLVKEHPQAKGLWGYQAFNSAGVFPKQLVEDKPRAFVCTPQSRRQSFTLTSRTSLELSMLLLGASGCFSLRRDPASH
jgi:hypothetical protein